MNEIELLKRDNEALNDVIRRHVNAAHRIDEFREELGLKLGDAYSIEGVIALVSAYKAAKDKIAKITGQYEALLYTLQDAAKADHRQYLYNEATLIKYLMAAADNEGEIRSAILEHAKDWIEGGKPATLKDVLSPVTVA